MIDGAPGLLWSVGGRPKVAFGFTIVDGKIVGIELVADPDRLAAMKLTLQSPNAP